jgi:branched-chain amino acid transport system permease protein
MRELRNAQRTRRRTRGADEPTRSLASRHRLLWFALIAFLAAPLVAGSQSWLLAYLAQTATMIVFALSYNLLLGETGLLSFGHAAYAGLGALVAARVFNQFGVPLPLLPLVGGLGGALCGVLLGAISTRRAGTAFAMITLGIGELVAAAAWTLPDWFGGEAGVPIDRASGLWFTAWNFGPARAAYGLIALWGLLACVALCALSRTPFMRLANAVRDNPVRAAAIGCYPWRIRYGVVVLSAFFAGIAGTLGLINVELVSTESVGMLRSGSVLIATVIGGTASFFGPVAGAIVLTFFSVVIADATRAWLLYLGLFFIVVVSVSPDGLTGWGRAQAARLAVHGWRRCLRPWLLGASALLLWTLAGVLAVQWAYAVQFGADNGERPQWLQWGSLAGLQIDAMWSGTWLALALCLLGGLGWLGARAARQAWMNLSREPGGQGGSP